MFWKDNYIRAVLLDMVGNSSFGQVCTVDSAISVQAQAFVIKD